MHSLDRALEVHTRDQVAPPHNNMKINREFTRSRCREAHSGMAHCAWRCRRHLTVWQWHHCYWLMVVESGMFRNNGSKDSHHTCASRVKSISGVGTA
jgi:hypothetical protein